MRQDLFVQIGRHQQAQNETTERVRNSGAVCAEGSSEAIRVEAGQTAKNCTHGYPRAISNNGETTVEIFILNLAKCCWVSENVFPVGEALSACTGGGASPTRQEATNHGMCGKSFVFFEFVEIDLPQGKHDNFDTSYVGRVSCAEYDKQREQLGTLHGRYRKQFCNT